MYITVRGKRWKLLFEYLSKSLKCWGICDSPAHSAKRIRVHKALRGEHRLEIILHEIMHAANWDLAEEAVAETARDMARTLTRLGYSNESAAKDGQQTQAR